MTLKELEKELKRLKKDMECLKSSAWYRCTSIVVPETREVKFKPVRGASHTPLPKYTTTSLGHGIHV